MGKLIQGFNGPFTGKLGPAVGSSWMGISVIRSRPTSKRTKFTPGELAQQMKFKLLQAFLNTAMHLMNETFRTQAVRMTGFNKGFSYNVKNVFTGVYPDLKIDSSLVVLSRGDLPNAGLPAAISTSPGLLNFSWTDNTGKGKAAQTDQAFMAAWCEKRRRWTYKLNAAERSSGNYAMDLKSFSGEPVDVYIGFISAEGNEVSDSLYLGKVEIANETTP
jgi:hypothetical protein